MDYSELFEEDIYWVKDSIALVISKPWHDISVDGRKMLQSLANALKLTPAPLITHFNQDELNNLSELPKKMVLFGHHLDGIKVHLPTAYKKSFITLTGSADEVALDQEMKKELWAAIRLMLSK